MIDDDALTADLPEYDPDEEISVDEETNTSTSEPNSSSDEVEPTQSEEQDDNNNIDFTTEVLRQRGISDPNKIKFADERTGAIVERSWNDLSRQEQINILTDQRDPKNELAQEEINLIQAIRQSGMSIDDYFSALQAEAAQAAQDEMEPNYEINNLTDDELYALDLMTKLGTEVTDEQLEERITAAKSNPELYSKEIQALRTQYQNLENENILRQQQAMQDEMENRYHEFANIVLEEIEGLSNGDLELSVDDKNDIANFTLTRDEAGLTDFGKILQDPKEFTKAAFWVRKGPELVAVLQEQMQEAYRRGFSDASRSKENRVTVQKQPIRNRPNIEFYGVDNENYLNN